MFRLLLSLLLVSSTVAVFRYRKSNIRSTAPPDGETYAVLVAGSNGWYNYRHQADTAHAYHTLVNHGFKKENIITMMYDDIANYPSNPYPGKLYNKPNGPDVYEGVKIDYKGKDVNPKNFLHVLSGNSSGVTGGNGRVLPSTKNDRIFVYFTDHGAVGLIAFPDEILSAKELNDALNAMYKANKYQQLVFYLEACESGSMFEKILKSNINVYAITAANAHESSYGTYCDNTMKLPCLGDLFSVNWMEDSDKEDLDKETLDDQFQVVLKLTNLSHVKRYGDLKIDTEPVGWFQGEEKAKRAAENIYTGPYQNWKSRDVELNTLRLLRDKAVDEDDVKYYNQQIEDLHERRIRIKSQVHLLVENIVRSPSMRQRVFSEKNAVLDPKCHHDVVKAFDEICIDFNENEYALKYASTLNNLCLMVDDSDRIIDAMIRVCTSEQFIML